MKINDQPIDWFYVLNRHPETGDVLAGTVDHQHLFIWLCIPLITKNDLILKSTPENRL